MRLKSYFTDSVEAAIALAGKELGEEAMLVYSREASPEARYLGAYEVVFSLPSGNEETRAAGPAPEIPARDSGAGSYTLVAAELAAIRRQLATLGAAVAEAGAPAFPPGGSMHETHAWLVAAGVAPSMARQLLVRLLREAEARRLRGGPAADAPAGTAVKSMIALRRTLGAMIQVDARIGAHGGGRRIAAMVGPPGAGKTTTLVKLAVAYGLQSRRPPLIISMDQFRVAGNEQLRTYAGILGVGFLALETVGALCQSIEEHRSKELILIDSPGLSERDMDVSTDLAKYLANNPEIDTHLVLTASMKTADLTRAVERYQRFAPAKLIFTRLDETQTFGSIWSEAARTGKAISFLSFGQQIPEDLEPASRERVLELLLAGVGPAVEASLAELEATAGAVAGMEADGVPMAEGGAGESAPPAPAMAMAAEAPIPGMLPAMAAVRAGARRGRAAAA